MFFDYETTQIHLKSDYFNFESIKISTDLLKINKRPELNIVYI